ncbi:MAG: hypothetical protein WCN95_06115 [bacterium]
MKRVLSLAAVMVMLSLAGCGGGSDQIGATGAWDVTYPTGLTEAIQMTQSGDQVSGTTDLGGTVAGTSSGAALNLTITYPDNYANSFSGNIDGNTLAGTVTAQSGHTGPVTGTRPEPETSNGNGGAFGPAGTTYSGNLTVTTSAPGIAGQTMTAPFYMQVGADGVIGFPVLPDATGISSQTAGNQFKISYSIVGIAYTYQGSISGDTITGTMLGILDPVTQNGTFSLVRGAVAALPTTGSQTMQGHPTDPNLGFEQSSSDRGTNRVRTGPIAEADFIPTMYGY